MSVYAYRRFRSDLREWAVVKFEEFRSVYEPLRRKKTWTDDDKAVLKKLADEGGAYALRQLYQRPASAKEQIEALLGSQGSKLECLTRAELKTHLAALIRSCRAGGWTSEIFASYQKYLDSDLGPESLGLSDADAKEATMHRSGAAPGVPALASHKKVEEDYFAEMYRQACAPFRAEVRAALEAGARAARTPVEQTSRSADKSDEKGESAGAAVATAAATPSEDDYDPMFDALRSVGKASNE